VHGCLPLSALLALLALPFSIQATRLLFRNAARPKQLGGAIKLSIGALLAHGALLSIGLLSGK
jgi:1,4-dihydroxy-2-naphthoate octaprenyltransferase